MSFEHRGRMPLDYQPVTYAGSVLRFRGPSRGMERPYVLCLGGTETFGRFIHAPYPAQLDAALQLDVVNMGVMNGGLDVLSGDPAIIAALQGASAVVLQIPGAQNMTNRFYSVHPRRNDRFIKATPMLRTIFRDVDFTEFHFTRHLLTHLQAISPDRFAIIEAELRTAWVARMSALLGKLTVPVHLLWLSRRAPGRPGRCGGQRGLGDDPLFVTPEMLEAVEGLASSLTIAAPAVGCDPGLTRGMFHAPREEAAARTLPGPDLHDMAAAALVARLG
jgi:hypothetical protein